MEKISIGQSNDFCPQPMFLYGTYKEDGKPNFGLFVWFSYIWDSELGVMACIGGEKLTKDRIKAKGVFSANLVSEPLLPLADYFGNKNGYDADKMNIPVEVEKGMKLDVPVLKDSPWVFELEVDKTIGLNGGEVLLCKIRNTLVDKRYNDENLSIEEKLKCMAPVIWLASDEHGKYYAINPKALGDTNKMHSLRHDVQK